MRPEVQYGICAKCKKQIMWIKMKSGKNMPCDPSFVYYKEKAGGKDRIVLPSGIVVTGEIQDRAEYADGFGYVSHFATCEYQNMLRREKNAVRV